MAEAIVSGLISGIVGAAVGGWAVHARMSKKAGRTKGDHSPAVAAESGSQPIVGESTVGQLVSAGRDVTVLADSAHLGHSAERSYRREIARATAELVRAIDYCRSPEQAVEHGQNLHSGPAEEISRLVQQASTDSTELELVVDPEIRDRLAELRNRLSRVHYLWIALFNFVAKGTKGLVPMDADARASVVSTATDGIRQILAGEVSPSQELSGKSVDDLKNEISARLRQLPD